MPAVSVAATAAAGDAVERRRRRRFVAGSRTAGHQSHAQRPRGQPAWGRRGVRSSSAIRKILLVVDSTRLAARRSDAALLRATPRERPERRRHALPVEGDDLIRRWRAATGLLEECGGLATPDPRHLVPALARRAALTALSAASRYRSLAGSDGLDRRRRGRRAPPESSAGAPAARARWSQRRRSRVQACRSISSSAFRLEDLDGCLGQVDRAAVRSAGRRSGGGSSGRAVYGQGADRAPRRSSGRRRAVVGAGSGAWRERSTTAVGVSTLSPELDRPRSRRRNAIRTTSVRWRTGPECGSNHVADLAAPPP